MPELSEVKSTDGKFIYQDQGRDGFFAGLETNEGRVFFSCKPMFGVYSNMCGGTPQYFREYKRTNKDLQREMFYVSKGKQARIFWFNQPINLFVSQKRIVEIIVDGKPMITREDLKHHILLNKGEWLTDVIFGAVYTLVMSFGTSNY